MKLLLPGLIISTMVGGIFSRWQKTQEPDLDQGVLDQLKKAGSDLSKPHNIEFFLYFPTEAAANEAAKAIGGLGCDVKVQLAADKTNWLCFANRLMVPDSDTLVGLRSRFNEIARKGNGEYDGWGTEVVK